MGLPARTFVRTLLFMAASAPAMAPAAGLRTYVFDGTVQSVANPTGVIDAATQPGSPFTLTVSIPADAPNVLGPNPKFGHYAFPTGVPGAGMSLEINGQTLHLGTPSDGEISVITNPPYGDAFYGYQLFSPAPQSGLSQVRVDFDLLSDTNRHLGDSLPDTVRLGDYPVNPSVFLHFFYQDDRAYPVVGGTIQAVQVNAQAVPEPSTAVLFGVVLLVVSLRRQRAS